MSARRRVRRETLLVLGGLAIPLVLANPPVIGLINAYAATQPLTLGVPTVWLWLEIWYGVMLIELVIFAVRLPSWQAHAIEERIDVVTRGGR